MPGITLLCHQEPISSVNGRDGRTRYLYCADDGGYWWWSDSGWHGPYGVDIRNDHEALDVAFANVP
jgi:hypothetical protein